MRAYGAEDVIVHDRVRECGQEKEPKQGADDAANHEQQQRHEQPGWKDLMQRRPNLPKPRRQPGRKVLGTVR